MHHLILQMGETQVRGHPYLNPLSYSCDSAEDFIPAFSFYPEGLRLAVLMPGPSKRGLRSLWASGLLTEAERSARGQENVDMTQIMPFLTFLFQEGPILNYRALRGYCA